MAFGSGLSDDRSPNPSLFGILSKICNEKGGQKRQSAPQELKYPMTRVK